MGSYTSFAIGGYHLGSSKGSYDPVVLMLFTESDRVNGKAALTDYFIAPDECDESERSMSEVGYSASASIVIDRLETMGFTLTAASLRFEEEVAKQLERFQEEMGDDETEREEMRFYSQLSFEMWLKTFRSITTKGIHEWHIRDWDPSHPAPDLLPLERFLLEDLDHQRFFRYPDGDFRFFIRAALEAFERDAICYLDLTDVIEGGYCNAKTRFAESARAELTVDHPFNSKVIILTEGTSDRRALEGALQLLYPHLVEYYSFMDFESASAPGGASRLVNVLKSFVGAGITNRVIALFDNDTGAASALRALDRVMMPSTMRALQLPSIPLCKNYPTKGPSGLTMMDVNGLAASVELYFGEDILRDKTGHLIPVHWRGYDPSLRAYQGEIEQKAVLQEKFHCKLKSALADQGLVATQDWSGMRSILDVVRKAFHGMSSNQW